jgi:hypothetical protein
MTKLQRRQSILFIFGPARGGTTYLANTLASFFDFADAPEGQFVADFLRRNGARDQILDRHEMERIAEELSKVPMLEIIRSRWPEDLRFDVTAEDLIANAEESTLSAALFAVFAIIADKRGAGRVGTKNPDYWKILGELRGLFKSRAKFLFIQRDGRDVYLSQSKLDWGGQSPYAVARNWRTMTRKVSDFAARHPSALLVIRYEDLLGHPSTTMHKIGTFIEADRADVDSAAQEFAKDSAESSFGNNFNKWAKNMRADELRVFEAVAGAELKAAGYETVNSSAQISWIEILKYEVVEFLRLVRLNAYVFVNRKMPADKAKWRDESGVIPRLLSRWLYRDKT